MKWFQFKCRGSFPSPPLHQISPKGKNRVCVIYEHQDHNQPPFLTFCSSNFDCQPKIILSSFILLLNIIFKVFYINFQTLNNYIPAYSLGYFGFIFLQNQWPLSVSDTIIWMLSAPLCLLLHFPILIQPLLLRAISWSLNVWLFPSTDNTDDKLVSSDLYHKPQLHVENDVAKMDLDL